MMSRTLEKIKQEFADTHELSDMDIPIATPCTLGPETVRSIMQSENGKVVKFCDMIDNYDSFKRDLENFLEFYNLPMDDKDDQRYDLKFILKDAKVSDIQSANDQYSHLLAGTLAMPHLHALNFPTDHYDGDFKKIFDLTKERNYMFGKPHSFCHTLKNSNIHKEYSLVGENSVVNPKILFPGHSEIRRVSNPLLYSWMINSDSIYDGSDYPTVVKYLRPSGPDSLQTDYRVNIPSSCFLRSWHRNQPSFDTETGCDIPLDLHTKAVYGFLDQANHSRATTFDRSGIWFDIQQRDAVPVKFILKCRIHPILPKVENKTSIPYLNFKRGLRMNLHCESKTF